MTFEKVKNTIYLDTVGNQEAEKELEWVRRGSLPLRNFDCGHCLRRVSSEKGWFKGEEPTDFNLQEDWDNYTFTDYIYICNCGKPTYFDEEGKQTPSQTLPGGEVKSLPPDVDELYSEARLCLSVSANTAVAMVCRKLLMSIAVKIGAKSDEKFGYYVKYLTENSRIFHLGNWVDEIRKIGNLANHEIESVSSDNAKRMILFIEVLLKAVYELPAMMSDPSQPKETD